MLAAPRETVHIEIMDGFSLQTDSNDAWHGLGDSVTTPFNKYYIWQCTTMSRAGCGGLQLCQLVTILYKHAAELAREVHLVS